MKKQNKTKQPLLDQPTESTQQIAELEALQNENKRLSNLLGEAKNKLSSLSAHKERTKSESAIKASDIKYRTIFERAPISITIVNKDGVIIDVNPYHIEKTLHNQLKYSQYVGQNILDNPALQQAGLIDAHHRVLKGEPIELQEVAFPPSELGPAIIANLRGVPLIEQNRVNGAIFILEDITERKQMQEEMHRTNEKLSALIRKFEEQNRFTNTLTEMRDLLQACSNIEEVAPIIMSSMKKLFPEAGGALFLMSPSRSDLESVAKWGEFPEDVSENVFAPNACWGLRRGHAHVVLDKNIGPICLHLKQIPAAGYVCLPLIAKGDVLGLLHLRSTHNSSTQSSQRVISDLRDMAVTLSEYLSLAIANIKLTESLSRQSIQDPLSGLFNRRFLEEFLQREILRAARKNTQIGIVMADLDHFKKFNDTYGHAAGDKLISEIGKVFTQNIRGSDIACRYGGEEFVLILTESSAENTFKRADSLRNELKKIEIVFQGQYLGSVTVSMGIATYPINGANMDELIRSADMTLYRAKQAGRDRVILTE